MNLHSESPAESIADSQSHLLPVLLNHHIFLLTSTPAEGFACNQKSHQRSLIRSTQMSLVKIITLGPKFWVVLYTSTDSQNNL